MTSGIEFSEGAQETGSYGCGKACEKYGRLLTIEIDWNGKVGERLRIEIIVGLCMRKFG